MDNPTYPNLDGWTPERATATEVSERQAATVSQSGEPTTRRSGQLMSSLATVGHELEELRRYLYALQFPVLPVRVNVAELIANVELAIRALEDAESRLLRASNAYARFQRLPRGITV